jgi:hypothetical protein
MVPEHHTRERSCGDGRRGNHWQILPDAVMRPTLRRPHGGTLASQPLGAFHMDTLRRHGRARVCPDPMIAMEFNQDFNELERSTCKQLKNKRSERDSPC